MTTDSLHCEQLCSVCYGEEVKYDTASLNSIIPTLWAPNNTLLPKLQNKVFTWDLFQFHVKKIQDNY